MLAHLLYEKLRDPQSAKDDLGATLPGLFGISAKSTFRKMVMDNSLAVFFPNSQLGTIDTALSYFVQTETPPFDELSIQLANYAKKNGWVANIGVQVAARALKPNLNNAFYLWYEGGYQVPASSKLILSWLYHTSTVTFDLEKQKVEFRNVYDDTRHLEVMFGELDQAKGDIQRVQRQRPIEIANIELTKGEETPVLGMKIIERQEQRPLFDIVVPAVIKVDPARLTRHITNPKYIDRLS